MFFLIQWRICLQIRKKCRKPYESLDFFFSLNFYIVVIEVYWFSSRHEMRFSQISEIFTEKAAIRYYLFFLSASSLNGMCAM